MQWQDEEEKDPIYLHDTLDNKDDDNDDEDPNYLEDEW